eukprot:1208351-Pleurochrysis_carterae.AAC.1
MPSHAKLKKFRPENTWKQVATECRTAVSGTLQLRAKFRYNSHTYAAREHIAAYPHCLDEI